MAPQMKGQGKALETTRKVGFLVLTSLFGFIGALLAFVWYVWTSDATTTGLQQGVSREQANDCPFALPASATDIYYAYELYWQGGASICRYTFPAGDIQKQAQAHLRPRGPWSWSEISPRSKPTLVEHRLMQHTWFQPATIEHGFESTTTGILWDPKVWIDAERRYIYILDQN